MPECKPYSCSLSNSCLQVLSPLPQFINPGNTAWADGGGSPLIYVMRCNPQHYYLLHEIGHRFGMPHATIYKLMNQTVTPQVGSGPCYMARGLLVHTFVPVVTQSMCPVLQAPTTALLSAGVMEDACKYAASAGCWLT